MPATIWAARSPSAVRGLVPGRVVWAARGETSREAAAIARVPRIAEPRRGRKVRPSPARRGACSRLYGGERGTANRSAVSATFLLHRLAREVNREVQYRPPA